jgi:endonuclease/exonuclease/phosphatase (EEP) superfamily protein YafD
VLITLALSCRGGGIIQVSEFPEQERYLPATITLFNWNAQKLLNARFPEDLQVLLEQQQPDMVFLQESRAELLQLRQIGGYFAEGWSYPWPDGITIGVLTLSRIAPDRVEPVPTKYREFFITAPKVSLITEHPLPNGETLLAVNVHLLNFERWRLLKLRSQLDELKTIIEHHPGPVLMAGDFNTWSRKRLRLVQELAEQLELREVTDFPPGRTTGDTHSACLNWLFGIKKDLPLDRVYYRGFTNHAAEVLPYESSDHKPIKVTLTLQSN